MNEEIRVIGYCEVCGSKIVDDNEVVYVDEEGHYFDSIECVMDYFCVTKA